MGRLLLLLIAASAVSSAALFNGETDNDAVETHVRSQNRALVRETAEDALAVVLDDAVDPAARRWRPGLSIGTTFEVDGQRIEVDRYALEDFGQTALVGLTAYRGGVAHRTEGRFRIADPDWPTPLWIASPYVIADVHPDALFDGTDPSRGGRPTYFDATRFSDYRLDGVLDTGDLVGDVGALLAAARGPDGGFSVVPDMDAVLALHTAPSITELYGRAIARFDAGLDTRIAGAHEVTGTETYGTYNDREDPDSRIVIVDGPLTVSGTLRGNGLLIVEGDLTVTGRLRWDGLVLVLDDGSETSDQLLTVDLEAGDVRIRGGLLIDQEAPPPGGHVDLTVNRDLTGLWATPAGEVGASTPAAAIYGAGWAFYNHAHRFDHKVPEVRSLYFAERGSDRHEFYTSFRKTLTDITTAYPGEEVYVRFDNVHNHGSATFQLRAGGDELAGAVSSGFGLEARAGDRWASPSYAPGDIDDLLVDVRSLRQLAHLTDGDTPASALWGGGACAVRPDCLGKLDDRDGALTVQIVLDKTDVALYEATIYWHTHAPGQPEAVMEEADDAAWREAIKSGAAQYGTSLRIGDGTVLRYDVNRVAGITSRLGFNALSVRHLGSFVEHLDTRAVHGTGS